MSDYRSKPLTNGKTRSETGLALVVCDELRTQRFHALIRKGDPDECWPWLGSTNRYGYGVYRTTYEYQRFAIAAHRLALALETAMPPSSHALHKCDNPPCCNPKHLYWGTQAQNIQDMLDRDRHVPGPGFTDSDRERGRATWTANLAMRRERQKALLPQAIMDYQAGIGLRSIAKAIDCPFNALRMLFAEAGVRLRGCGRVPGRKPAAQ